MAASTQALDSLQGFVQLPAKLRAILRADSRNSLRSTATTSFARMQSRGRQFMQILRRAPEMDLNDR